MFCVVIEEKESGRSLVEGEFETKEEAEAKLEELKQSIIEHGDFGSFIINEKCELIGGTQRHAAIMSIDPETPLLCKMLIGYSTAELRGINILDNTHAGEWDLEGLADWTKDLNFDLGIDLSKANPNDRQIEDMELIHYEKYNYVMIVCRYETDYNDLLRKLNLEGKKVKICKKRKIAARAIWYDSMKKQLISKEEAEEREKKS